MWKKTILVSLVGIGLSILVGNQSTTDLITSVISTVFPKNRGTDNEEKLFTADELKLYNGVDNPDLYLAALGIVFNVTRGAKHYAPKKQYHVFVGRDASRSFVTGKFNKEEISDEVADLSPNELLTLNQWVTFYQRDYKIVGKLIGRYYDASGKMTAYGEEVSNLIEKAQASKEKENAVKSKFPPCNMEWDQNTGTKFWCTKQSGGIERDWVGLPRKLYEVGSKDFRCACINDLEKYKDIIEEYEGCDKKSTSCFVKNE